MPWVLGLLGLIADPAGATWLWMVLTGIGQGAGIALVLTLIVLRAPTPSTPPRCRAWRRASATRRGARTAAARRVHDVTGGWDAPIAIMLVVSSACSLTGSGARARPLRVRRRDPPDRRVFARGGWTARRGAGRGMLPASFDPADPQPLVEAALACPLCLHASNWHAVPGPPRVHVHRVRSTRLVLVYGPQLLA